MKCLKVFGVRIMFFFFFLLLAGVSGVYAENTPPVADAGDDQTVNEGDTVILDGKDSNDPDGEIVSYQWVQTSGTTVTLSAPNSNRTIFDTPDAGKSQVTLTFTLTVKDDDNSQAADTVEITVKAKGVTSFTSATEKTMWIKTGNGTSLTSLTGKTSDSISGDDKPEDIIYGLIETEAIVDNTGDTAAIIFFLPQAAPTGYHWYRYINSKWYYYDDTVFNSDRTQVKLGITDGGSVDGDGTKNSYVKDFSGLGKPKGTSSSSLVADAGDDQTVNEGDSVILDGKDSYDPDGDTITYTWKQTSGTTVTLSASNSNRTTFDTPDAGKSQITLTFTLTVKDDDNNQATDTVDITVKTNGVTSFTSATNKTMWIKTGTGTSLTDINVSSSDSISGTDKPDDMLYGLIETKVTVTNPGDTAGITFFLPQAAPTGYNWYRYSNGKWYYYDNTVFNSDRTQVKLGITDGGTVDGDGAKNGSVKDLSGLGKPKGTSTDPDDNGNTASGESADDTNGCFISTVISNRS